MAHKIFVSYHHANDQAKANYLRSYYGSDNTLIDHSLPSELNSDDNDYILGQIRTKHLKDSTVTIVLIGSETHARKWIDWEIYSSLRPHGLRTRNGLLGIFLPTAGVAPARLQDNINSGYAITMNWSNISFQLESKIEQAFINRNKIELVQNWRPRRKNNS